MRIIRLLGRDSTHTLTRSSVGNFLKFANNADLVLRDKVLAVGRGIFGGLKSRLLGNWVTGRLLNFVGFRITIFQGF